MEKNQLAKLIEQQLTQRQIALILGVSQCTIRWWLRKYDLKTKSGPRGRYAQKNNQIYSCPCGETDPNRFYGRKKYKCASCHNQYTKEKGQLKRSRAIKHLGGSCIVCGYQQHACSLDIHHKDPSIKDTSFQSLRSWSWERIEKEITNCVLLCKNCHAAHHAGKISLPG